jgi:hypothetical protein
MLIGAKTERVVVDGDDLIRPYSIRPAYREDPSPPVWPEWARIALNVMAWIVLPGLFWGAIALRIIHSWMPTIQ